MDIRNFTFSFRFELFFMKPQTAAFLVRISRMINERIDDYVEKYGALSFSLLVLSHL